MLSTVTVSDSAGHGTAATGACSTWQVSNLKVELKPQAKLRLPFKFRLGRKLRPLPLKRPAAAGLPPPGRRAGYRRRPPRQTVRPSDSDFEPAAARFRELRLGPGLRRPGRSPSHAGVTGCQWSGTVTGSLSSLSPPVLRLVSPTEGPRPGRANSNSGWRLLRVVTRSGRGIAARRVLGVGRPCTDDASRYDSDASAGPRARLSRYRVAPV